MKRLFFCSLFVLALTLIAFFFGLVTMSVYWGMVAAVSALVGILLGTAFGAIDIREKKAPVSVTAPVSSKQF